ncbi:DciA family protein [Streptomyces sp. NPDC101117]|uniref:DciA family protein n=1 Tax=Streptomyces sp. NPDC101117 TaxID=3366108 RepID=UPI0037FF1E64
MTDTPQPSGRDLARQALDEYKKRTWAVPSNTPPRAKPKRRVRLGGEGRDPVSLAGALDALNLDVPLQAGLAGGNLLDQWATLCPQYEHTVQPVTYDPDRGRLDLRPSSDAYAAQLRLLGGQLAKQINDKLGRPVVRSIRVLPVGAIQPRNTRPAADPTETPRHEAPVKTRDTASPGYRATLEAALTHRPDRAPTNPYVLEAIARQEAALRAKRQPEAEHREAHWAQQDAEEKAGPAPGSVEESLARARAYARQTRAGRAPRRAFDVA